jgi:aryl-phospho-beta-D-glucosidase BglC (GH1 family)
MLSTSAFAQLPTPSYGLNLGNTFEAGCGIGCWGPPMPTQAGINGMAAAGFNTLRIPCGWMIHSNTQGTIDPTYMAQVTSVVNWALAANMYVIINDHYDNGWFEDCGFKSYSSRINGKLQNMWTQVANNFKNTSPHLLFACANEPNTGNSQSATSVLLQYYQTFVNTVRGTGGNNATRWLVIQAPGASIDYASSYMPPSSFPADPAHSLMLESHFYDPYQFSQMTSDASWGAMYYFWGSGFHVSKQITNRNATWGEESYMSAEIAKAKDNFISKGIPVLAGEWRAVPKPAETDLTGQYITQNYNSAQYWNYFFHNTAVADGLSCTCWQTDDIIDQVTGAVINQDALNGVRGVSYPAPIAGL